MTLKKDSWPKLALTALAMFLCLGGASPAQQTQVIAYKISAVFFDQTQQRAIPTPQPVVEKIKQAFALWASVREARLRFVYRGLEDFKYATLNEVPNDKCIYINLSGTALPHGTAGTGGYVGNIPDGYIKGLVVLNTSQGAYVLSYNTIIHEIGHALGLEHSASAANIMLCGTRAWGDNEYLAFNEQDRADLLGLWAPQSVFAISGIVTTANNDGMAMVFAVNVDNGHAYSTLADNGGRFKINIMQAGTYRVFAKRYELSGSIGPVPSWYVSNDASTNDPNAGAKLRLESNAREARNIKIKLLNEQAPFAFTRAIMYDPKDGYKTHGFFTPGTRLHVMLPWIQPEMIAALEAYGTRPDCHFSGLAWDAARQTYVVDVAIDANAGCGERLVVARCRNGVIQAGLIGISISAITPRLISITDDVRNPNYGPMTPAAQLAGKFDFTKLNPDYWR